MSEHDVYKLFRQYGPIDNIRKSKPTIAYLIFESNETARQFQPERRVTIDNRRFLVQYLNDDVRVEQKEEFHILCREAIEKMALLHIDQDKIKASLINKSDDELLEIFKKRHWIHYGHIACNDERFIAIAKTAIASQTVVVSNSYDYRGDNQSTLTRFEACLRMFGSAIKSMKLQRINGNRNVILQMAFEYCANLTELFIEENTFILSGGLPPQYDFPSNCPSKLVRLKMVVPHGMQQPVIPFRNQLQTFEYKDNTLEENRELLHKMRIHNFL